MAPEEEASGESEEPRLDRWLRPFFTESMLWPVTFTVSSVAALFLATILVVAVRQRSPFAGAALLGVAWLSVEPLREAFARRRLGPASGFVLALWLLASALAVLGARSGYL